MLDSLLPIEADTKEALETRISYLQGIVGNSFDQKYDRIDLGFLTRRRRQGLFGWQRSVPAFAVFDPGGDGTFRICGTEHGEYVSTEVFPEFPSSDDLFDDVGHNIVRSRVFGNISKCRITCRFDGAIPQGAREMIKRAMDEFEGRVLLVTEAPRWRIDLEVKRPPPDPDPLVVGYDGDEAWLVGHFDLTDVEAAIKAEFCTREGGR